MFNPFTDFGFRKNIRQKKLIKIYQSGFEMNFSIDQSEDKKPWFRDYKYPKGAQSGTGGY